LQYIRTYFEDIPTEYDEDEVDKAPLKICQNDQGFESPTQLVKTKDTIHHETKEIMIDQQIERKVSINSSRASPNNSSPTNENKFNTILEEESLAIDAASDYQRSRCAVAVPNYNQTNRVIQRFDEPKSSHCVRCHKD
jgi:hypothetical protein